MSSTPEPFLVPPPGKAGKTHLRWGDATDRAACKNRSVEPTYFKPATHPTGDMCLDCAALLCKMLLREATQP